MTTATIDDEVRSYVEQVASHLQDLPEDERADLLEDLRQHLTEVATEGEGSLADRLGPPDEYARELRASAELPEERDRPGWARRVARAIERSRTARAMGSVAQTRAVRSVQDALGEMRPAWWAIRGYAAVSLGLIVLHGGYGARDNGPAGLADVLAPEIGDSRAAGVAIAATVAWLAFGLGRRAVEGGRARWVSALSSVAVVVLAGMAIGASSGAVVYADYEDEIIPYLQHEDGTAISNICPYGADGKPLAGVLLFDQDGRAIRNVDRSQIDDGTLLPSGTIGLDNSYPRPMRGVDPETGVAREIVCPKLDLGGTQPPAR